MKMNETQFYNCSLNFSRNFIKRILSNTHCRRKPFVRCTLYFNDRSFSWCIIHMRKSDAFEAVWNKTNLLPVGRTSCFVSEQPLRYKNRYRHIHRFLWRLRFKRISPVSFHAWRCEKNFSKKNHTKFKIQNSLGQTRFLFGTGDENSIDG